jgi:hypothetical protein
MQELDQSANWMCSYLEWMELEEASVAPGREWAEAYLDWVDAPQRARDSRAELRRADMFREAMALMAARSESDCAHVAEVLRHAEQLLEDERGAWRALNMLRRCDRRRDRPPLAGDDASAWQASLEDLVTELHALSGKVEARMRACSSASTTSSS